MCDERGGCRRVSVGAAAPGHECPGYTYKAGSSRRQVERPPAAPFRGLRRNSRAPSGPGACGPMFAVRRCCRTGRAAPPGAPPGRTPGDSAPARPQRLETAGERADQLGRRRVEADTVEHARVVRVGDAELV